MPKAKQQDAPCKKDNPCSRKHLRRVLFVLEHFAPYVGGAETLFQQLTEGLAAEGWKVTVVTSALKGTKLREEKNGVAIKRVRIPPFAARYFFTLFAIPVAIREAKNVEIVHATVYNAALPAWLASFLRRKPCVLTVHEVFAKQWRELKDLSKWMGWIYFWYEWFILHLPFTHYICDSNFTLKRLLKHMRRRSLGAATVYPAIDYDFWDANQHKPVALKKPLRLDDGTKVYLYFGRPGISKGLEYLLRAVSDIRKRIPKSHLVVILAREPKAQYENALKRIKDLGISNDITVLDPVPKSLLPSYLLACDCVVVPSISEGFGYSGVETATLGVPLVTTRGHSLEEVLGDYPTYALPRSPETLVDAVCKTLEEAPQRNSIEKKFDRNQHVEGVLRVYETSLQTEGSNLLVDARSRRLPRPSGSQ